MGAGTLSLGQFSISKIKSYYEKECSNIQFYDSGIGNESLESYFETLPEDLWYEEGEFDKNRSKSCSLMDDTGVRRWVYFILGCFLALKLASRIIPDGKSFAINFERTEQEFNSADCQEKKLIWSDNNSHSKPEEETRRRLCEMIFALMIEIDSRLNCFIKTMRGSFKEETVQSVVEQLFSNSRVSVKDSQNISDKPSKLLLESYISETDRVSIRQEYLSLSESLNTSQPANYDDITLWVMAIRNYYEKKVGSLQRLKDLNVPICCGIVCSWF